MEFPAKLNQRHKAALFLTLLATGVSLVLGVAAKQTAGIVLLGFAFAWALGSNNRLVHALFIAIGLILAIGPVFKDWYGQRNEMKEYRKSVADFEQRIPELAKHYPSYVGLASKGEGQDVKGLEDIRVDRAAAKSSPKSQHIKLPDGSYGEFPADAKDQEIIVAVEKRFPGTFDRYMKMPDAKYWMISLTPKDGADAQARRVRTKFAEQFPNYPQWHIDALLGGVDVDVVPSYEEPGPQPEPFSVSVALTTNWMFDLPGLLLSIIGLSLVLWVNPETASILK